MKIAIIGAGAMGCLYGGYLSKNNKKVYLIDPWIEHVNKINEEGLIIEENTGCVKTYPKAILNSDSIGIADLVIVFVKSTNTERVIKENKTLIGKDTMVLTLQNGYGNVEKINKYVSIENIIFGTTSHGCTRIKSGYIKHGGCGDTHIGIIDKKNKDKLYEIYNILNEAGFKTEICEEPIKIIWNKLVINVGINAITAILNIKNGYLLKNQYALDIMEKAVEEAVKVANAKGFNFNLKHSIKKVKEVAFNTSENESSMLQDILHKRRTEIDTINKSIVEEGKKYLIPTPVNEMLTNLVKALEFKLK
ncbi:ketopantoate reductase family protein [Clostridium niameyense]|uniref:ketopantoate reductase family protein n=1 Tax=Clostridium niameyense TaxID=1622073 RepID=UPI00067EF4A5|nr:ketopantoate reductase family protein [Clostridium niameyense]